MLTGEVERLPVGGTDIRRIEPELRHFVVSHMSQDVAEDALQETLQAIAKNLQGFRGHTTSQFGNGATLFVGTKLGGITAIRQLNEYSCTAG